MVLTIAQMVKLSNNNAKVRNFCITLYKFYTIIGIGYWPIVADNLPKPSDALEQSRRDEEFGIYACTPYGLIRGWLACRSDDANSGGYGGIGRGGDDSCAGRNGGIQA
jgi:hypothetical protein